MTARREHRFWITRRARRPSPGRDWWSVWWSDRGSGTVYALVVVAIVAAVGLGAAMVGGAMVARHRAMSAADLAALAAADALVRTDADPCAAAERIAARHRVELRTCIIDGPVVDVVVRVPVVGPVGLGLVAEMRSRAGPSDRMG